ncbi:MAG: SpoIVB peptidase [Ruminococcus sp.]|uniref:SpoIVB peptidase n=1 Tax=Ruminococcus sp. TaxID=41978 RepID=UPI0025E2EA60|nr:SpoIVB peptidase [Ruminococcus sp.]MCR5600428.1 SpoIVB peptidase [Ruminococcus sp.]
MRLKRKIIKTAAALLSAAFVGLYGTAGYYSSRLPSVINAEQTDEIKIAGFSELKCTCSRGDAIPALGRGIAAEQVTFSLFGVIPVKNVEIHRAEAPVYAVGGIPFGIKLLMEGVMVTGLGDVECESGTVVCPAEKAGIRRGDIIRLADGETLTSNDQLQGLISSSGGKTVELSVERDGDVFSALLQPVLSRRSGGWKGGMWVRDSIAGIGTMTFFDKESGSFVGLGHPICDSDTGGIVPVHSGEAVPVEITDVKRGARGIPGELRGSFSAGDSFGSLSRNKTSGIYGSLSAEAAAELSEECEEYKMAFRQEIEVGPAEVITTISGERPEKYAAEVVSVDYSSAGTSKNMVIRITDERLIEAVGGIVQGMSGSPIIQNGKLIGAVTHVFVADPAQGYGIFAETMYDEMG